MPRGYITYPMVHRATKVLSSGASYAMNQETVVNVNKTSGSVTAITLPAGPLNGQVAIVIDGKGDAATNNITVTGAAGNIDGQANYVISTNYGAVEFIYDSVSATPEWKVLMVKTAGALANVNVPNYLLLSNLTGITAGTTRTQLGATPILNTIVNRVDTSTAPTAGTTLGDGILLPVSQAGMVIVIINNTANIITIWGAGSDTINGAASVPIPPNCTEMFECPVAGAWYYDAGVGFSGPLNTVLAADSITAGAAGQSTATQLVADFNRVVTATAGQGVKLPASAPGLDVIVQNHSGVSIVVYGLSTDKIDDVTAATGVTQMDRSVVIYTCYATGNWYSNGLATGYAPNPQGSTALETMQFADNLTALTGGQGSSLQLTAALNTVATVPSGGGVNLPASAPGLQVTVIHTGVNNLQVYPAQGSSDTINGIVAANGITLLPGTTATFNCTATGAWNVQPSTTKNAAFNTANNTTNFTASAAQVTGGAATVDLALTGTLGSGQNVQLPTAAAIILAMHSPVIGSAYRLRIINESGGAFAWTVTKTDANITLTGGVGINQNTWREFVVTVTSLTTITVQNVATGTWS